MNSQFLSCFSNDGGDCGTGTCEVAIGDVNGNGLHNVLDIVVLANCVLSDNWDELRYEIMLQPKFLPIIGH